MYSWDKDFSEYRYDSIQNHYVEDYLDDEDDSLEVSLDVILEDEAEALELEEVF